MIEKRLLVIGVFSYIIIFLFFYPPIFALRDESEYLSMTYILKKGHLFIGNEDIPFGLIINSTGHRVPFYPIGQSVLLLPLIFLGWKSIFLLGIGFHLLGVLFFVKLMRLFKIENLNLALLYLFFPAFIFYSRTIMSDIPSVTLFLMACYFYFKPQGHRFISGILFGIMTLLRAANIILFFPFLVMSIIKSFRSREYKRILYLFFPALPFILLAASLNYIYYGSPLLVGYSHKFTGMTYFSPVYFLPNFKYYVTSLMLLYPLMLLAPFLAKKTRRTELFLLIILFIILYSSYYFHDKFPNGLLTYIFGTRLLFPIIALLLFFYVDFLDKILQKFSPVLRRLTMSFILISLVSSCILINYRHQQFLRNQLALKDSIYKSTEEGSAIIYDYNTAELILKIWGDRRYVRYDDYKDLLERLKKITPFNKNIYLVKRDVIYAGIEKKGGISQEEIAQIRQYYNFQEIKQLDGLKIFRLIK